MRNGLQTMGLDRTMQPDGYGRIDLYTQGKGLLMIEQLCLVVICVNASESVPRSVSQPAGSLDR